MKKLSIVVVGGDMATVAEGVPIVNTLRQRGHSVRWIMDPEGEGGKKLKTLGIPFEVDSGAYLPIGTPDFVLVLTSATANTAQHNWTQNSKDLCIPVGWYEDFAGTAHVEEVRSLQPDFIMVINNAAADIARRVRPTVPVEVVGKPSFEFRIDVIKNAITSRRALRKQLLLEEYEFVLLYWSGGEIRERVEQQVSALRHFSHNHADIIFVPRIHPKLERLGEGTVNAMFEFACSGSARTIDWRAEEADVINSVSDVVVCDAGCTEGIISALMGIPTIITRFPDDYERLTSRGLPGGIPMLVDCGAVLSAESDKQLEFLLDLLVGMWSEHDGLGDCWHDFLDRCHAQAALLKSLLEPGAAERIAKVIEEWCN